MNRQIQLGAKRTRIALVAAAVIASSGAAVAVSTQAEAGSTPKCNSVTTHEGERTPGYNGQRTPCYLSYGSRGDVVKVLQRYLNSVALDTPLTVDGSYGPATKRAVVTFQQRWNAYSCASSSSVRSIRLSTDGAGGPMTSKVSQNLLEYCGD